MASKWKICFSTLKNKVILDIVKNNNNLEAQFKS